ncbi:urokinase-type plasminogen activator-like [Thalassophryne amazonica]|uniref:urokinase-type plasminogen activator-like n=1 Tax=Thalassophryne amazonica TaxID=390379 RepID=UPI0014718A1E|nr:urokinase-type plasminogen activator-like [Thalassophryne amazonica]
MDLYVVLIIAGFCIDAAFPLKSSKRRFLLKHWGDHRVQLTQECLSGDGSNYRGSVSESVRGRRCLYWNKFTNPWGNSEGIGKHNNCRNPDQNLMPWCRVRRGRKIVREFCDIPKCPTSAPKPPVSPAVDTELTCGETSERKMNKIVGGSFAPIHSHPWVAAIFHRQDGFLCGGSLIAPCWVLTAAHCFAYSEFSTTKDLTVYLGKKAINETDISTEQKFTVEKLINHQTFSEDSFNNDIALLKIKSKHGRCAVKSPSVRTVCLPPLHTKLPAGLQCSIAGFGKERLGALHFSQYLKQAKVVLLSQTVCQREQHYGNRITENMFCAGSPDYSTDACKGDSGGPLVCEFSGKMFLFGVVSWGEGCAMQNKPGVYTRVTNFNSWIAEKAGLHNYTAGVMYPIK